MGKFSKWIGAGLGWTIGGPIGALVGFAFGSLVDASNIEKFENTRIDTTTGDFVVSLLVLMAAVMKADRKVVQSELAFVKQYLVKAFGEPFTAIMDKVDAEWTIKFEDGTLATIYNWKNGKNYLGEKGLELSDIGIWNIGGFEKKAVEAVAAAIRNTYATI